MKTYRGTPDSNTAEAAVTVNGRPLPLCLHIRNHSPTGFAWGYGGSGPAQLALALLVDFLGDEKEAQALYQSFKSRVTARLPMGEPWTLTDDDMRAHVEALRSDLAASLSFPTDASE